MCLIRPNTNIFLSSFLSFKNNGLNISIHTGAMLYTNGYKTLEMLVSSINGDTVPGQYVFQMKDAPFITCSFDDEMEIRASYQLQSSRMAFLYRCKSTENILKVPSMVKLNINNNYFTVPIVEQRRLATRQVTACVAPVYNINKNDFIVWLESNMKSSISLFVIYVRSHLLLYLKKILRWYIENNIVVVIDAGNSPENGNKLSSKYNTEKYDKNDILLHSEYKDQVLLLNHCMHRFGQGSKWIINIDIDEIVKGNIAKEFEYYKNSSALIQTVAFTTDKSIPYDKMLPFVSRFSLRQRTPIDAKYQWPRTKLVTDPLRTSFNWIHSTFDPKDSCYNPWNHIHDFRKVRINHYVDLLVDTKIHGGKYRCDSIYKGLPCNYPDYTMAMETHNYLHKHDKYIQYVEADGLNNQVIALQHAIWLSIHTRRTLIVPDRFEYHKESLQSPTEQLYVCDVFDCDIISTYTSIVMRSTVSTILNIDDNDECKDDECYSKTFDAKILYIRNKHLFRMGMRPETYSFLKIVKNIPDYDKTLVYKPKLVNRVYSIVKNTNFSCLHIRSISIHDYGLGEELNLKKERTPLKVSGRKIVSSFDQGLIYIMTNSVDSIKNIEWLTNFGYTLQLIDSLLYDETQDLRCIIHSIACGMYAKQFYGDVMSTVTQNIMRTRFMYRKDPKISCNPFWCHFKKKNNIM